MTRVRQGLLFALLALAALRVSAYDASDAVQVARGTLPLILTVPHDGGDHVGHVPVRSKGALSRDAGTRELAERVSDLLQKRLGARPYLVVARFNRKFVDANRAEADALESPDALPAWRAYHENVAAFIAEVKTKFPAGALLIDVHGQSDEPDVVFRGTRAGLTARALLQRSGAEALQGPGSLIGRLAARGYRVVPDIGAAPLREDPRFNGGYTVFTYGSQHDTGIDAIQLEFGRNLRSRPELPEALADAIAAFLVDYGYLPTKP
jgi:N-formylglutamate amidohydrolase